MSDCVIPNTTVKIEKIPYARELFRGSTANSLARIIIHNKSKLNKRVLCAPAQSFIYLAAKRGPCKHITRYHVGSENSMR